jgi:hypothetical protein
VDALAFVLCIIFRLRAWDSPPGAVSVEWDMGMERSTGEEEAEEELFTGLFT